MKMVPNKGKQTLRKANGKPKEQTKTSVSKPCPVVKKESVEPAEIKENTLTFPLLKTVDNGRLMPRYTSIINRTEEEGVRFEDLDILKIELKGLLANVSVRVRVLQGELKNLANAADEKKEKKRLMLDKAPASPAKRGKYEDKPIKKLKEAPVRGRELMSSPPSIKITRVKSITVNGPVPPSAALPPEPEPPRIITPRNDNSSKFWQSLEQYCSDITPMDIKFLEECIRCREKGPDLAPIPRLGEHFASRWAKEDLRAEQEASSSSAGERRGVAGGTSALVGSRRAVAAAKGPDANGPFTQRLVSALIEENMISPKEIITEPVCKDGENITPLKPNKIVNNNTVTSATNVSLEKIVIKELEEQGLLEKDAQPKILNGVGYSSSYFRGCDARVSASGLPQRGSRIIDPRFILLIHTPSNAIDVSRDFSSSNWYIWLIFLINANFVLLTSPFRLIYNAMICLNALPTFLMHALTE
ncbi:transcriptional adapter 3-B isoform X3 [Ischnura elegans]|uniref:transcriptional adapter 3-B isoform X3 n=1 Tax=Ischnura elegans TaxID=197161 RepID=UPI001ED88226|nr:transcriptional adapter 3-B isoform X3 [Ischnura elegans]